MSIETTNALVLRTFDFSESSLVVSLFTRNFGKVRGLAKGARRLKNSFETSLDALASIRVSFIRKNSDALDLLTEAKLVRRFRPNARNLRGLYAGWYVVELLDLATADYEPFPELWDKANETLARFQRDADVFQRLTAFEAALLEALGEFPATRFCVECGEELPLDEVKNLDRRILFAPVEGGVVCARCRREKEFVSLVPTTIGALRGLEDALSCSDGAEPPRFAAAPPNVRVGLRDLLDRYICRVLNRRPKLAEHMRFIVSEPPAPPPERPDASAQTFSVSQIDDVSGERPSESTSETAVAR